MTKEQALSTNKDGLKRSDLSSEKLIIWLNFWKFIITTLIVGVVTTIVNWQIQLYELKLERQKREQDYIAQFLQQAMDENLDKRLRFAHYFSKLTLSADMNQLWNTYYNDLQGQELATKERITYLQEKLNKLRRKQRLNPLEEEQVTLLTSQIALLRKDLPLDVSPSSNWLPENLNQRIHESTTLTWKDATNGGERIPKSPEHVQNIISLAIELQKVNAQFEREFGKPIKVVTWYRPEPWNSQEGGARRSTHLDGRGVDLIVEGHTGKELALRVAHWWPGGIGVYPGSREAILHLDIGAKRKWGF